MVSETPYSPLVIRPDELLEHWQGHRRLTRRVIQAFPEGELFGFSVGGMRPCAALALEMISMAGAGIRGLAYGHRSTSWHTTRRGPLRRRKLRFFGSGMR